MFDHLEPRTERQVTSHHKLALLFLVVGSLVLAISFSLILIPQNSPLDAETPIVITLDDDFAQPRSFVGDQDNIILASYYVQAPEGSALEKLSFRLEGLYVPQNFGTFQLYLDETQLGNDVTMDANGKINFLFDNIHLTKGVHNFKLRSDWELLSQDQTFSVVLDDDSSLSIVTPTGQRAIETVFPLATALTTFAEQGEIYIFTANDSPHITSIVPAKNQFVDYYFNIGSQSESFDVTQIDMSLIGEDIKIVEAQLYSNNLLLADWQNIVSLQTKLKTGQLVVSPSQATNLKLRVYIDEPVQPATLELAITGIKALGVDSGQEISSVKQQSQLVHLVPDVLDVKLLTQSNARSYSLNLKSRSGSNVILSQLPLEISTDLPIESWQVLVDNVAVDQSVEQKNNILVFNFEPPLNLNPAAEVKIVPNKANTAAKGFVAFRLVDDQIVWTTAKQNDLWFAQRDFGTAVLGIEYIQL